MITPEYTKLMARYHIWQNTAQIEAADQLTDEQRRHDRGAFFGSIFATMNHLLWGDQMWLHRLAGTPPPVGTEIRKSQHLHATWNQYVEDRKSTDERILDWVSSIDEEQLSGELTWASNVTGQKTTRPRALLVMQLFNHGTHHRGQVHAMLTASGAELPDTDLQYMPGYWN